MRRSPVSNAKTNYIYSIFIWLSIWVLELSIGVLEFIHVEIPQGRQRGEIGSFMSEIPEYILGGILIYLVAGWLAGYISSEINGSKLKLWFYNIANSSVLLSGVTAADIILTPKLFLLYILPANIPDYSTLIHIIILSSTYAVAAAVYVTIKKLKIRAYAEITAAFSIILIVLGITVIDKGSVEAIPDNKSIIIIGIDSFPQSGTLFTERLRGIFNDDMFVFTNAITPIARSYPSWITTFSGKYPWKTGARYNLIDESFLNIDENFLIRKLDSINFRTVYSMDEGRFSRYGPIHGFDKVYDVNPGLADFIIGNNFKFVLTNLLIYYSKRDIFPLINNNYASSAYNFDKFADEVIRRFRNESNIANKDGKNLFFVNYFTGAHWPHESKITTRLKTGKNYRNIEEHTRWVNNLIKTEDQVVKFVRFLKSSGTWDKSTVVIMSDHGEASGPKMFSSHGGSLIPKDQNSIILAFKPPHSHAHKTFENLVSNLDIAPTLAYIYGFDIGKSNPQFNKDIHAIDGVVLPPFKSPPEGRKVFLETGINMMNTEQLEPWMIKRSISEATKMYSGKNGEPFVLKPYHKLIVRSKQYGLTDGKIKLIYHGAARRDHTLYNKKAEKVTYRIIDMENDPEGNHDLLYDSPELMQRYSEEFKNLKEYSQLGLD